VLLNFKRCCKDNFTENNKNLEGNYTQKQNKCIVYNINTFEGEIMIRNNLLKIRLSLGYKFSKDFAEYLDVNANLYGRWESNAAQPSGENLLKICNRTGLTIQDILYEEEQ
jgi:putative transcriptional regulator